MSEVNYQNEGGIFQYPKLQPVRFYLNFDPPQLGLVYKRTPLEKKKHLFLVQLNKLILLGDPEKITQAIFDKYPAFFNEELLKADQVYGLVCKLVEYIQKLITKFQEEEEEVEGHDLANDSDIYEYQTAIASSK
jgi:hypothetical protein